MNQAGVSAVLSFFIPGLGQIFNGQIMKGISFFLVHSINLLLCWILIGFITTPIFFIYNIFDAYKVGKEKSLPS